MSSHIVLHNQLKKLEKEQNIVTDKTLLLNNVQIKQSADEEFGMVRKSISMNQESDGSISATSIKPYNFIRANQIEFKLAILRQIGPVGTMVVGIVLKSLISTIFGFITLLGLFLEKSKYVFNQQDAKVLFIIYQLGSTCEVSKIYAEFENVFDIKIESGNLVRSLSMLASINTISITESQVEIIEMINLNKNW